MCTMPWVSFDWDLLGGTATYSPRTRSYGGMKNHEVDNDLEAGQQPHDFFSSMFVWKPTAYNLQRIEMGKKRN